MANFALRDWGGWNESSLTTDMMKANRSNILSVMTQGPVGRAVLFFALLAGLTGCKEEASDPEEVAALTEEVAVQRERLEASEARIAEVEKLNAELVQKNSEAKQTIRDLWDQLETVGSELEAQDRENGKPEDIGAVAGGDKPEEPPVVEKADETPVAVNDEPAEMEEEPVVVKEEPVKVDKTKVAKEKMYEVADALVSIKGDKQSGEGVLISADGKVWIYTAASLVEANRSMKITRTDRSAITKFGAFELVSGADVVRIEVLAGSDLTVPLGAGQEKLAAALPILGLDQGLAVTGTITAVTATTLQVSEDLSGQPGAPVFHGESGNFLGIMGTPAAAQRTLWSGGAAPGSELLVQRLDRALKWSAVPIGSFLKEKRVIEETIKCTRLAEAFLKVKRGEEPVAAAAGAEDTVEDKTWDLGTEVVAGISVEDVFEENEGLSVVRSAIDLNTWLEGRGARGSTADVRRKTMNVYRAMQDALRAQVASMSGKTFSAANASAAAQSLKWAKDADARLAELLVSLEDK